MEVTPQFVVERLIAPWLWLLLALIVLLLMERWIRRRIVALAYLAFRRDEASVVVYYLVMLPGVFLHEFSHWLVAGALFVPTSRFVLWPRREAGRLRLGYVEMDDPGPLRSAIIGAAPLAFGLAAVTAISRHVGVPMLALALGDGDLDRFFGILREMASSPIFWLWLYLLFTVSNTMFPSPADRRGWTLVGVIMIGVAVLVASSGFAGELVVFLAGPVADTLTSLTTTFLSIIALDLVVMAILSPVEVMVYHLTGLRVEYHVVEEEPDVEAEDERESLPQPRSITEVPLPVPPPPAGAKLPDPDRSHPPVPPVDGSSLG